MNLEHLVSLESKRVLQERITKDEDVLRRHRSHLGASHTRLFWENFSMKINKTAMKYSPLIKIKIKDINKHMIDD